MNIIKRFNQRLAADQATSNQKYQTYPEIVFNEHLAKMEQTLQNLSFSDYKRLKQNMFVVDSKLISFDYNLSAEEEGVAKIQCGYMADHINSLLHKHEYEQDIKVHTKVHSMGVFNLSYTCKVNYYLTSNAREKYYDSGEFNKY